MGTITKMINEQRQDEKYKKQKAYLVALASCIRETEIGSEKHSDILWVIRHQKAILSNKKLIEMLGGSECAIQLVDDSL